MNGRLLLVLGVWAALIPGIAVLISEEPEIEPEEPVKTSEIIRTPTLVMLEYTKDRRKDNLTEMGLTGEALEMAFEEATGLQARRTEVESILAGTNVNNIAFSFCRQGVPMPYRAAFLLLSGDSGRPQLVEMDRNWGKPWKLFPQNEVKKLFERWEVQRERKPEDTMMAMSALLLGATTQASITPSPPWDKRSWEGGSIAAITAVHGSVNVPLMIGRYLGRAHFIAEIVQADEVTYGCKAEVKKPTGP